MTKRVLREPIKGSRSLNNFFIVIILYLAGISFFLVGFSSYIKKNLFPFTDGSNLSFLPQGLAMTFYGSLAFIVAIYLTLNIFLDVGSGYNEFSKKDNTIRVVRRGFLGKNRFIFLTYPFTSVKKIKVLFKQGLNPRNNVFLVLKDSREIPLYSSQDYIPISEIEKKAITLAEFVEVPLENDFSSY